MLPKRASDIISFMRKVIAPFLLFLLVIVIFHSWFLPGLLTSFDFVYFSQDMMKTATFNIYAWNWHSGLDGFARFISPYSWITPLINFPQVIFGNLGFDWGIIERIVYLYPLLLLLTLSPILLVKYFFPKNKFYLFSVLVFSFNTYSLLLAGGEIFLALAYSLIPIVLVLFAHMITTGGSNGYFKYKFSLVTGLIFALQVMIDPRFAFVTLSCVIFYAIFYGIFQIKSFNKNDIKKYLRELTFIFLIPALITVLLHAFWIIPSIMYGKNPVVTLGSSYSTGGAVEYLSFAKLENTISLLHSNWPENIFGKVYFMRPEFLLIPILAFVSLFFISREKDKRIKITVLFFALLGIVGAFLAKGSNDPFGSIYLWAFSNVPGFIMFRDPAKWYPLVAISYAVLIPYSISKIYEWLKLNNKLQIKKKFINLQNLFLTLAIVYLVLIIKPAVQGQLGGMFKNTLVPQDYIKLEKFLIAQSKYSRTLWFPSKQKFGYYSNNHPEISAQVLFNDTNYQSLIKKLSEGETEKLLEDVSIKYVIVPNDFEKEIFINDRKYDESLYKRTLDDVSKISYLKKIGDFGRIGVFALPNSKDHFWTTSKTLSLKYQFISPVEYKVEVENAKKGDLIIFTENYDKHWVARNSEFKIQSLKFDGKLNSFILPKDGSYSLDIYFTLQDFVNTGMIMSIITLFSSLSILIVITLKKK